MSSIVPLAQNQLKIWSISYGAKLEGVDFHVYYDGDLGNGRLSLGVVGTKTTKSTANFGVATDELGNGGPELVFSTFAGYKTGGLSSRVTVNYSGKYRDSSPNVAGVLGNPINAFTTVNLNLGYEWGETAGALSGRDGSQKMRPSTKSIR